MKQSIRALGWTITISMIILFAFLVTAVYSLAQSILMSQGMQFGDFQLHIQNNTFILSATLIINNTGYYDITDLNLTTVLRDPNGTVIAEASTPFGKIAKGSTVAEMHNISLNLADILSNMTYLLFEDTELKIDFSMEMSYAYALNFRFTMANMSMPWGAPLYNFNITGISPPYFNGTQLMLDIFLGFENHSPLDIAGIVNLMIYNETGGYIGRGSGVINATSHSGFGGPITILVENPSSYSGAGYVEVSFDIPDIGHVELGRIYYG